MDNSATSKEDDTEPVLCDGSEINIVAVEAESSSSGVVVPGSSDINSGRSMKAEKDGSCEGHIAENETGSESEALSDTANEMTKFDESTKIPPVPMEEPIVSDDASSADIAAELNSDAQVAESDENLYDADVMSLSAAAVAINDNNVVFSCDDNMITSNSVSLVSPATTCDTSPILIDEATNAAAAAANALNTAPVTPRERSEPPKKPPASALSRASSTASTSSILKNPLKKKKKKKSKEGSSSCPPPQSNPLLSGSVMDDNGLENEFDKEYAGIHSCDCAVPLLLLSLPVDSLHCIASFLSTTDWSNMSLSSRGANRACREIFRRARMHGYRCATEVVMAWMRGQHADARELSALYIKSGVPIYPISLGHSYHTLLWRMGVEAKEMEAETVPTGDDETNSDNESSSRNKPKVDKFYSDRYEARNHDGYYIPNLTYLEEKSLFWKYRNEATAEDDNFTNMHPGRRHSLANGMALRPPPLAIPGVNAGGAGGPMFPPNPMGAGRLGANNRGSPRYRRTASSGALPSSPYRSAAPQSPGRPKVSVCIHRHLADQHIFGRQAVDDEDGTMKAASISLAADFFHPHLVAQVKPPSFQSPYNRRSYQEPGMPAVDNYPGPHGAGEQIPTQPPIEPDMFAPNAMDLADAAATPTSAAPTLESDGPLVHAEPPRDVTDMINDVAGQPAAFHASSLTAALQEQPAMHTRPLSALSHSVSFGNLSTLGRETNSLVYHSEHTVLSEISLDVYSCASSIGKSDIDGGSDAAQSNTLEGTGNPSRQKIQQLLARFKAYQRRLDSFLSHFDSVGFEDCLLDFWDEFFPMTAGIQFYDRNSPVPRMSGLHRFLTKPCPKAIGIVQCEIERIKISSKKKGVNVKGRLFPTYEYRLFIRDRRHGSGESPSNGPGQPARKDTVLMTAKNRGRKHQSISGASTGSSGSKRGVNNFYLCLPQQPDAEKHFQTVNDPSLWKTENQSWAVSPSGGVPTPSSSPPIELGRLQSNFIGTEFQIFSPCLTKRRNRRSSSEPVNDDGGPAYTSEDDADTDSNYMSDTPNTRSRKKRGLRRLSRRPSFSRRGSSFYNSEEEEDDTSSRHSDPTSGRRSRRGSWPSLYSSKQSRTSRRAIANAVDSSDGPNIASISQPVMSEEETGAITYTANLLGNRPRIMDVCIPKVLLSGSVSDEWRRYTESCTNSDESRMLNRFKVLQQRLDNPDGGNNGMGGNNNAQDNNDLDAEGEENVDMNINENAEGNVEEGEIDNTNENVAVTGTGGTSNNMEDYGLLALQNRPPWWNIELGAFVLNFGGRVSVASVKNFQLCDRHDHDYIMLQFGRIQGRHSFTMDFQYPLTAVQAFAIAISSLQSKISFG
uniref:Tubby C-terminal domain-containing protein n=1 Tax=Ditylum brightwellii TaxID=49249 RepID=A0A7S1ZHA6_9STRA|mmetsp:Transcript_31812/g.47453  ORF Transcript_31812/g.47453 Transcript_31812/m.47453 type:complete len:1354 (+) Transcript_31812:170-4231(+)